MRLFLVALAALVVSGCVSTPKYVTPPDTSQLRAAINSGQLATAQGRAAAKASTRAVKDAQKRTEDLLRTAPVDLRPLLEELREKLATAEQELAIVEVKAQETEVAFRTSLDRITLLEAENGKLAKACSEAQTKAEQYNAARKIAQAEKTKWVLLFSGLVVLVVGFFVARQYFPFLKVI